MAVPPTSARRSGWLLAVLAAAALHMLVFDRGLGGDGWAGFSVLTSLCDDHDLWLENNHRGQLNGLIAGSAGHLVSQYPPGGPLLDALPFAAGRAVDALLPSRLLAGGVELPPLGRVPRGVFLSAAAIVLARNAAVLLGLLWTALALRRLGCGPRAAAAGAALAFFGGPLIFYSLVGMTHAPAFALAALLFLLLVRLHPAVAPPPRSAAAEKGAEAGTEKLRLAALPAWTAGLALGAAVLVRYDAIALLPPALLALRGLDRRRCLSFGLGLALPLLALPPWWRACFGSWLPPSYGGRVEISFASPWNVLFSPVHGLSWFHPALLIAVAGLAAGPPALGPSAVGLAAARAGWRSIALLWFLSVATLHGWWSEWANLGGYGQRFLCDALPALALGFAWRMGGGRANGAAGGAAGGAAHAKRAAAIFLVVLIVALAATAFGYGLFFAAVGGLAAPPPPYPWPLRVRDYAPLVRRPPGPPGLPGAEEIGRALCRASFTVRLIARGCR
jgi:hypothetical protein